jgi:hypothetical protein
MTEAEHAEISRRLALAIGWLDNGIGADDWPDPDVVVFSEDYGRVSWCAVWCNNDWRTFDYRDPAVIWPIAERFNAFPYALRDNGGELTGRWNAWVSRGQDISADTAALAVALAVIKAKESK